MLTMMNLAGADHEDSTQVAYLLRVSGTYITPTVNPMTNLLRASGTYLTPVASPTTTLLRASVTYATPVANITLGEVA